MRVIVLTSTFLRHQFVINRVARQLEVAGVWQERKSFAPMRYAASEADQAVIARHFEARDRSEAEWFAGDARLALAPGAVHRVVDPGQCNDPAELTLMRTARPDALLVFGTGILKGDLIAAFEGHIINIHLGLSPYYRGAGTNFWPLVNREPEYVGATIHYLDAGIDTGPIIQHVRPEIRPADGPHDLGNRTIVAAADAVVAAALAHAAGRVVAEPQIPGGRLYRRKDFSAEAVQQLYRNFETGMVEEYLRARTSRDAALQLKTAPDVASGRVAGSSVDPR